ncbi:MAG: protein TolQ [Gammaproteobacteria bacterium]
MPADLSFLGLILNASPVVQFILLVLILTSVASWTIIFKKRMTIAHARREADAFEDDFWSGVDLAVLYARLNRNDQDPYGMAAIFLAGFQEFLRLRGQPDFDPALVVSAAQRAMRAALAREVEDLDMYLPTLATVGSTSPYIGLFGTVWGIMNSFRALGAVQQATLSQVAPGISEALIATAMGLFAAIPAVMAYNRSSTDVDRVVNRYESFIEEFSNILQRQSYQLRAAPERLDAYS